LRFEVSNGIPCCRSCHERIDSDFLAKLDVMRRLMSPEQMEALSLRAVSRGKTDLDLTLMFLQQLSAGSGK
jgi:hypothetical protein